jgi:hypothetical protein
MHAARGRWPAAAAQPEGLRLWAHGAVHAEIVNRLLPRSFYSGACTKCRRVYAYFIPWRQIDEKGTVCWHLRNQSG